MKPAIKGILVAGIGCMLGAPLIGLVATVIAMVGAFHSLGDAGISDPKLLASHIGTALVATMAGLLMGVVGLVLVVVAAIMHFATRGNPPPDGQRVTPTNP